MPIIGSELMLYKSQVVTNDNTNGGRMSSNAVASGTANNFFPAITEAQRIAGITVKRKGFYKVANDADIQALNGKVWIRDITPGGTRNVLYAGTQRNTAGDLTGAERKYGVGRLNADVIASATTVIVDVEPGNGAENVFQAGDTLYINDGVHDEYAVVDTASAVGDQYTITLTAGLLYSYAVVTPTTISSCLESATVETTADTWGETSAAGTYDEATYPIVGDNIGTIEQTWTLTFSDASNFSVVGDTVGSVGAGSIGGDFAPANPDFAKPYFTLPAAGWGGTWANGDTIVFQTHPAAIPIWLDLIVPAGTASFANDGAGIFMSVESA